MKIYLAVLFDRHCNDTYSAHETLNGANQAIEEFMDSYDDEEWEEEDWGRPKWLRYVHSECGDGPKMLIEEVELEP